MDRVRKHAIKLLREAADDLRDTGYRRYEDDDEMLEMFQDDAADIDKIADLLKKNARDTDRKAMEHARRMDTSPREEIPEDVFGYLQLCADS